MLVNGVAVERTDLGPTPDLVMHQPGERSPALWRVHVRAPYVVHNGLACDIVLWAYQPPEDENYGEDGDGMGRTPGSRPAISPVGRARRLVMSSPFR